MKTIICLAIALAAFGCTSESTNETPGNGGALNTGGTAGTGAAVGAGGIAGGPGQDAATPTPIHSLSETAHSPDYDFTITGVAEAALDTGPCPVASYFMPPAGKIKLGVEIKITATGSKQVPVNPFYSAITDSTGHSEPPTFGGCEPELVATKIDPGQTATGWITFELPDTAVGLIFSYDPVVIGTPNGQVKFDLGR